VVETLIAVGLLLGLARRLVYLGGALWSLAIWVVPEAFGGSFLAGATDIGTAIMYVLVFAVLYAIGVGLFLLDGDDPLPRRADAVVVLAGSKKRLPVALALMRAHEAPTLVVSTDAADHDPARFRLCTGPKPHGYTLICRRADPFSTRGEARLTRQLVLEHGWRSLVVVSSRYHLFRAQKLFERCTRVRLSMRGTDADPWWRKAIEVPLELVKLARDETVKRGC